MSPRVHETEVMDIRIRQASPADVTVIEGLLLDAAAWVDALGVVMWEEGELAHERVAADVAAGQFFVAEVAGAAAGAVRFQVDDQLFWPDMPAGDAAFVHRLVVSRTFKGRGVSQALLAWAAARARVLGMRYLRLDCDANRRKLRSLYERFGFQFHSFRQVGSYYVARYQLPVQSGSGDGVCG